jgi:hypothetical protein
MAEAFMAGNSIRAAYEVELPFQAGDGDELTMLRERLKFVRAFLRDADRNRRTGGNVSGMSRSGVRRARDVAFDDEDALDDLILQRQVGALRPPGPCPGRLFWAT